jgi:hypothetical protein
MGSCSSFVLHDDCSIVALSPVALPDAPSVQQNFHPKRATGLTTPRELITVISALAGNILKSIELRSNLLIAGTVFAGRLRRIARYLRQGRRIRIGRYERLAFDDYAHRGRDLFSPQSGTVQLCAELD